MPCLPAVATTGLFVAVILLDLMTKEWRRVPGRALFGVFSVLLVLFICERGSEWMAWTLLGAPFLLIFLGYIFQIQYTNGNGSYDDSYEEEVQGCGCPCCHFRPCRCPRPCPNPNPCPPPKPKPKPCPEPKPKEC
jgi:hypothetical protein